MTVAKISVVIPCWGDEALLQKEIGGWSQIPDVEEVIVIHAGKFDSIPCPRILQLIASTPNRGLQMNFGASSATGDILLFHHADSVLTAAHISAISQALENPELVGGAFHRKFDERHRAFRWIRHFERWRNQHFGSLFGDQSIFVRRAHFSKLGGFRDFPLMEDMEFSKRLRRSGRIILLDPPMESSARRHKKRGAWKTSLQNALFIVLYHLGVSPFILHRWYYGSTAPAAASP